MQELLSVEDGQSHPRLMTFKYQEKGIEYLLYEKRSYHFPDPRKRIEQGRNPIQKPVDKDDHMMENERRIVEYIYDSSLSVVDMEDVYPKFSLGGSLLDINWENEDEM